MASKKDCLLGALKKWHPDGNGQLNHEQLIALMKSIGMQWSAPEINALAEQLPDPVPIETLIDWLYSGVDQLSSDCKADTLAPETCPDEQNTIDLCDQIRAMPLSSLDYQTPAGRLEQLIHMRAICFIKGSWLRERALLGKKIPRRQEMPMAAFWEPHELLKRWKSSQRKTEQSLVTERELSMGALALFPIAISYCWCSKDHPDPDPECFHLLRIAQIIEGFQKLSRMEKGWDDFAFFWDYMSLFQKPRTPLEDALFRLALDNMQLVYGHQLVWVWKFRAMPPCLDENGKFRPLDENGKFQLADGKCIGYTYGSRGWPTFESTTADASRGVAFSRLAFDEDISMQGLSLKEVYRKFGSAGVAVHPEGFAEILAATTFTNGADHDTVLNLYSRTFEELKKATNQNLQGVKWTEEAMRMYFQAFREMEDLELFGLVHSPDVGIDGARRFLQQLAARPKLRGFFLLNVGLDAADTDVLIEEFRMFFMRTDMYDGDLRLIGSTPLGNPFGAIGAKVPKLGWLPTVGGLPTLGCPMGSKGGMGSMGGMCSTGGMGGTGMTMSGMGRSQSRDSLDVDERLLQEMEDRLDAELGADVHNFETFGETKPWSFEENLAANLRNEEAQMSRASKEKGEGPSSTEVWLDRGMQHGRHE